MKKVNKNSLPLRENSLPLRGLFCGQTASSLRPYGRSGQIICIGHLQIPKKKPQLGPNAHVTQKPQIFNIFPLCLHLSGPPEISHPPYLPNGDRLWWDYYTIGFRTHENGGVGHLKTQKKKPNFGGNTHVTLNPKP